MTLAIEPADVYGDAGDILLRVGNGGAGQAGLVKALADAYIASRVQGGQTPFRVAWYKSDTTVTLGYLKDGTIDVGLTYNAAAEAIAVADGYANAYAYAFRDHFCIVGPKANPAGLVAGEDALTAFQRLYTAAEATTTPATRFLSRFDKSATNIKESALWTAIGQVPWGIPYSTWYHVFLQFPIQALEAAATLGQYTLTDWGTWLSTDVSDSLVIYRKGSDAPDDLLLNPCRALASTRTGATAEAMAKDFIAWMVSEAGQGVITGFQKNGQPLYSGAPTPGVS